MIFTTCCRTVNSLDQPIILEPNQLDSPGTVEKNIIPVHQYEHLSEISGKFNILNLRINNFIRILLKN